MEGSFLHAVIKSGGKQYRVAVGDTIRVERLTAVAGETVTITDVLLISDDTGVRIGAPVLQEAVTATVKGHGRGEKVRIFKLRRRKNSRRRAGHRQHYTELQVTGIAGRIQTVVGKEADEGAQAPSAEE
jgi:large subunit ribosomal protein L21